MSDFHTAVKWLNHFDKSNMNDATRFLFEKFQEADVSGENPEQHARVLEAAAKASRNPSATAEVLILIAEYQYQAGHFFQAWTGLINAVKIYEGELKAKESRTSLHHLWVARWLFGLAAWQMHINYSAYGIWRRASDDLEKLIQNSIDVGDVEKKDWYQNIKANMDVDYACRAEEVLTWLYNFPVQNVRVRKPEQKKSLDTMHVVDDYESEMNTVGISKMRGDLVRMRNQIIVEIKRVEEERKKDFIDRVSEYEAIGLKIQNLLEVIKLRSDMDERAEAFLECGLAWHEIQDQREAISCMESAVSNYLPGSHQKAVARWMLGLMQLQSDSSRTRAFDNFQKAINLMEELNQRAGIANNKPLVDWYTYKIITLSKARDRLRS